VRRGQALAAAGPGLALSVLGAFHPAQLTPATAAAWWQLHVVLLPVFPLLGAALLFLHSHIYWPVGGLAMLAAGIGCGLLEWRPTLRRELSDT